MVDQRWRTCYTPPKIWNERSIFEYHTEPGARTMSPFAPHTAESAPEASRAGTRLEMARPGGLVAALRRVRPRTPRVNGLSHDD